MKSDSRRTSFAQSAKKKNFFSKSPVHSDKSSMNHYREISVLRISGLSATCDRAREEKERERERGR